MNRLALIVVLLSAAAAAAQQPGAANREAMKKLDYLVGKWKGDATASLGKEPKQLKQSEDVQFKLEASSYRGGDQPEEARRKNEEGILFSRKPSCPTTLRRISTIKAHRMEGQSVDGYDPTKRALSGIQAANAALVNTMTLTAKDEWHEIGEYSTANRDRFEMALTRVKVTVNPRIALRLSTIGRLGDDVVTVGISSPSTTHRTDGSWNCRRRQRSASKALASSVSDPRQALRAGGGVLERNESLIDDPATSAGD